MRNKSFTLIEVMVALYVLIVGLLAAVSLLVRTMSLTEVTAEKFIAANLAQEGIEIVRNIRDNNILSSRSWNAGLNTGSYRADYNDNVLLSYDGRYLLFNFSTGLFSYDSGNKSIFRREIKISYPNSYEMKVNSLVSWQVKGINFDLNVEDHLYDYY